MKNSEEKKIKLLLKDFLNNHSDYQDNSVYIEIYDDNDEIFQKVFSYFHEKMNNLFEFMNTKNTVNNHYNADNSRELLLIINELREIKKGLQNTDYDFIINDSYIEQIKYVKGFLENSGGSRIPDDYKKFEVIKYEPIFNLKNKEVHLKDFDHSVNVQASFKVDAITIKINEDILEHVKTLLETGHYFNAVEESYKIVREKLKSITGKEKAHEAFKDDNYVLIFGKEAKDEAEKDFFEGVKFLHMAIQKLRNEKAHTPANDIDKNLAIHYIVLASLAYDLISRN
jgi:uncharacterized protein (TIGR02391 family)